VVGEVGTGKTTLARALAGVIPHDESVLVIEDTPEIRLDHPHVRYVTTREANLEGAGRVSPAQCIRAGMRMAMNRIIFGEIRDAEAAEAFVDVCASGHPGLCTLHGRSALDAVTRLELFLARAQRNADKTLLSAQVVTAVQVVVVVDLCKVTGVRRIMEVRELGPVADGVLRQREIFAYKAAGGVPQWSVVNRVSENLEKECPNFSFAKMPDILELPLEVSYREAAQSLSR
jgi:pilus assembly protein CpaF